MPHPVPCPRATFFVMAYRQEAVVEQAVASVLAQEGEPLEILLSDDASPDGTFAIMQEMAAAYRGPHLVRLNRNPANLGIIGHVNRIAELASGRFIIHGAGDDVSEPNRAAQLLAAWNDGADGVMAVHSNVLKIDAQDRALEVSGPHPGILSDPRPVDIVRTMANCIGAAAAWDRRVFERFGPIPPFCEVEDAPLFFRAALLGRIVHLDAPLVRYRVGGLSDRSQVSPGHDHLYGDRMKYACWKVAKARSFLRDMEREPFPGMTECEAECKALVDRLGFEVELWRMSPRQRVAALPAALGRSLATRRASFFAQAVRHALGPLYVRYYNIRRGGRRRQAASDVGS